MHIAVLLCFCVSTSMAHGIIGGRCSNLSTLPTTDPNPSCCFFSLIAFSSSQTILRHQASLLSPTDRSLDTFFFFHSSVFIPAPNLPQASLDSYFDSPSLMFPSSDLAHILHLFLYNFARGVRSVAPTGPLVSFFPLAQTFSFPIPTQARVVSVSLHRVYYRVFALVLVVLACLSFHKVLVLTS